MPEVDRSAIVSAAAKGPKSRLGYWPFIFPSLLLLGGVCLQAVLLILLKSGNSELEVLLKIGDDVRPALDHDLVRRAILSATFLMTLSFALLAYLADQIIKTRRLLRDAAELIPE